MKDKLKIAYIVPSLASQGGAERIISDKASYMADKLGNDVTMITYCQLSSQTNAYPLSSGVSQINLAIPYHLQYKAKLPKRIYLRWKLRREVKQKLTDIIQQLDPDILVGVSYLNGDIMCSLPCRAAKVIETHETRLFTLQLDGESRFRPFNCLKRLYNNNYFRKIEKHADIVVTLTQGDAKLWNKAKRVEVIPNFSNMPISRLSNCENKRVIAVGRLEWQKGYDQLFEAWKQIETKHPDWKLDIFGSGRLESELKELLAAFQLKTVKINSFTPDISEKYAMSSICVLSSRFEGFSLVLLEAMRHGVPCVTFNCPFGPSDVLEDGKCGFVVSNGDVNALSEKICLLIENEYLRKQYATAAIKRAEVFDTDKIMQHWNNLFRELASNR